MAIIRKLYGTVDSVSTMRALASLFEHELEFEFVAIDLKSREHKKEPFLSLNPFGEVPVYQEDDLIIFESRAIMRTISHTYPKIEKEQIYMNPKLQGIAAAWIDVEDHEFSPPASTIISEFIFKKNNISSPLDKDKDTSPYFEVLALSPPVDYSVVAQAETELAKVLDVYDERLKESKYLGGDKFTSADLTHLPYLYYLMKTPTKQLFDERTYVRAWCSKILSRPGWLKVEEMITKAAQNAQK